MTSFTLDIQKFVTGAKQRANDAVGRIVVGVSAEIDMRSPVDTGRFRGNWQLGVNSVPSGTLANLDKTGNATQARIAASVPDEAAGHVFWIVNNLPYATRLEHGYSRQAPQGMVGLTLTRFQSIVNEAAAAVR